MTAPLKFLFVFVVVFVFIFVFVFVFVFAFAGDGVACLLLRPGGWENDLAMRAMPLLEQVPVHGEGAH